MSLELSGQTLGTLIANALAALPSPGSVSYPDAASAQAAALAFQIQTWTAVSNQIISYFISNTVVSTSDTVPSLGLIAPTGGGPVTGAVVGATGSGTIS
jgi:hypothetical protein